MQRRGGGKPKGEITLTGGSLWAGERIRRLFQTILTLGCLVGLLSGPRLATAQWVSSGIEGGPVGTLVIDPQSPTTLYAGTFDRGLFVNLVGGSIPDVGVFVPIIVSTTGLNGSFFTSEMTLTNRGTGNATVNFTYASSIGNGSGTATDSLEPGQQKVVADAIEYLRSLGIPISTSGNQGGALQVTFSGLSSPSDGGVTVRTTTVVPQGRAGLAYSSLPTSMALTEPSYIIGLRQNQTDRSNVAIENVGSASEGNITLRLTVFSGDGTAPASTVLPDQIVAPGGWLQISGILGSNGLSLTNGYVRVERVNGTASYYAYGVINDQANSDGSFVPPVAENWLDGKFWLTLPVIVETNAYSSELVVTNWSLTKKKLELLYVADAVQGPGNVAQFRLDVNPSEQQILPDFVQKMRDSSVSGIGPKGPSFAGSLFIIDANLGDLSGISVSARTSTPGGGGRYGLFYTGVPSGSEATTNAWIYGLQQNDETRTNLALINTGVTDTSSDVLQIELFDGNTGQLVSTHDVTVNATRWIQINSILALYAPGTTQGYAHITRTSGSNPFITYAVINDGGKPGERSGDGAFTAGSP